MNREQKTAAVEQIASQIGEAQAIYSVDYRGITVAQAATLRSRLRETDASFRIVKNTLTLLAAEKAGAQEIKELVEGPTAFTFVQGDPAQAAKALDTFARQENVLEVRGGVLEGVLIDAAAFRTLARLPGRDQLNAQFAGVVAAPLTGLVRGLNALLAGVAVALGQLSEQRAGEAPPPAEEPPAEEAEAPAAAEAESAEEEAPEEKPEEAGGSEEPAAEEAQPAAEETQAAEEPQAEQEEADQ
jgi:large subunit ribosomal protein L10